MADDLHWWDKIFGDPSDAKFLTKMKDVIADIKKTVGVFSSTGEGNCNCLMSLTIAGHGGPGMIAIGDGMVSGELVEMWKKIKDILASKGKAIDDPKLFPEEAFLKEVSGLLCDKAKVEFVTCSSGKGPSGKVLKEWLKSILGSDVDVKLYEDVVKFAYGKPKVCKTKSCE